MNVAAIAYRCDGSKIRVQFLNFSYEGCHLETEKTLLVGEKITLNVSGLGGVTAEVRWATKQRAGARFVPDSPLSVQGQRQAVA